MSPHENHDERQYTENKEVSVYVGDPDPIRPTP